MRSYTGKTLLAVWKVDSVSYTKNVAALTREDATQVYKEHYNLTNEEVIDLKLTRVKHLWSTKEGVVNGFKQTLINSLYENSI